MITIHEAGAAGFDTLGLGALTPTECMIDERAGGLYELKLVHPVTDDYRHTLLAQYRIIKAPAPVRETPLLELGQSGSVTREIYRVATGGARLNMRAAPNGKIMHAYPPGTEVVKIGQSDDGTWLQVALMDGGATGWMFAEYLELVRTETESVAGDTPGIVQPRQTREQLFRIVDTEPDSKLRTVTAWAQHITYDLKGAIVVGEYEPDGVSADVVCAQLMARADHDVSDFHIYCAVDGKITGSYGGRNIIDCLLDPETGVAAQTGARVVRDNYDIFLLPDEERSRGVELRYGKNLLSAAMTTSVADVITRIRPVGKDAEGGKLYIEDNNGFVDSTRIDEYPVIYSKEIEYDVAVSDELPVNEAREQLKAKAQADFDAGCDLAGVTLNVDFIRVELTEKYKHLASAYALHMYDRVPVIDRDAGIVATVRMIGYRYDGLLDRYDKTILGDIGDVETTVQGYEIAPGSVSGTKIVPNSMSGDRLRNLSVGYGKFNAAAIGQLAANAITAVRADIRKLVAGEVTADQLYADLAAIAVAQITTANIKKANIEWAEIAKLTAAIANIASAEIGRATIGWVQIKKALIEKELVKELAASEGNIVSLNADVIKTGTLSADRLLLKGTDGLFYAINAGAGGLTETQLTEEMYRNAISGTALVAESVTADKINVFDLFAAKATIAELESWLVKTSIIEGLNDQLIFVAGRTVGGTNLISSAEGNIWVKTGDVSYEWEKNSYYNRSGTGVWMTAWSDSHNEIRFNTNIHVQPGEYTLSFYSWCTDLTTSIRIRPNLLGNGADLYFDNQAFMPASETPTRHVIPLDVNHTGDVILRFVTMTPWTAGNVYFSDVKLESGNMATDWSPAPEDIEAAIGDVRQAVMEITPEYIVQQVIESDEYTEDMASIRTTAQEIQLAVESRQVGGTNLVSLADGSVYVRGGNGSIDRTWSKESHCQSGVGILMYPPASGDYNCLYFDCGLNVAPGEYTLSFYCWTDFDGAQPVIRCNLNGEGHDHYFGDVSVPAWTPTRMTVTFDVDYEAGVVLRLLTWSVFTGNILITDVKLETGNTATAWSPYPGDPAGELDTGTGGGVQVTITKDRFNVNVPGADGDFELNETGGVLPVLRSKYVESPNLAYAYDGPATITVKPDATSEEIAAGGVYKSLPEALAALNNRQLAYDVTINVMGDSYGFEELYGVHGSPNGIVINGNGKTLIGRFRAVNCSTNIAINGLTFAYDSAYGKDYAVNFDNCSHIDLKNCVITGNKLAARGAWFAWGTRAYLEACEFYDVTDSAIRAGDNVDLLVMNAKGSADYYLWANGATIKWGGTRPAGLYYEDVPSICTDLTKLSVDYGSAAPEITTPVTAEYPMQHADSYAGGYENSWNYQSHDDIMQGYTEHAGRIYGCIWFDNAAIRAAVAGKTVKQATIRLTAQRYVGRGVAVEVHLYGTTTEYAGRNGPPVLMNYDSGGYGVIGTATPGETTTISIPIEAAADLASGAISGLVLYSDDETLYGNRNYSRNYMRFDGSTSGDASTRPVLTVVYE